MNALITALRALLKKYGSRVVIEGLITAVSVATAIDFAKDDDPIEGIVTYASESEAQYALVADAAVRAGIDPGTFMLPHLLSTSNLKALSASLVDVYTHLFEAENKDEQILADPGKGIADDAVRLQLGKIVVDQHGSLEMFWARKIAMDTLTRADIDWLIMVRDNK